MPGLRSGCCSPVVAGKGARMEVGSRGLGWDVAVPSGAAAGLENRRCCLWRSRPLRARLPRGRAAALVLGAGSAASARNSLRDLALAGWGSLAAFWRPPPPPKKSSCARSRRGVFVLRVPEVDQRKGTSRVEKGELPRRSLSCGL